MICEVSGIPYWCSLCPVLDEIEEGSKCPKGVSKDVASNLHKETKEPEQRTVRENKNYVVCNTRRGQRSKSIT